MKICPKCNTKYTDETLNFCLQDGTNLIGKSTESGSHQTVSFEETPTVVSSRKPEKISFDLNEQKHQDSQAKSVSIDQDKSSKSNTLTAVLLTAFAMLLLFGLGGIGGYYYFNNNNSVATAKTNVSGNQNKNSSQNIKDNSEKFDDSKNSTPKNTVKSKPKKTIKPTPSPTIDTNPAETKKAVSDTIYNWKSLAEARNLTDYMDRYASKLDYYNKKGASRSFVKNDKKKAFNKYDSIKAKFSNMSIKPSDDGNTAVAVFDKEWIFKSADSENSGKVQSQLKFKKDGEKWLIVSEKDLKTYYVNK